MSSIKQSLLRRLVFFITGVCFGFFQTVIFIPDSCAQSAAPQASGPIDIQANEQEFAENVVLAKGDVTVTYKDSVIKAPEAKLFRDQAGQPQKAEFIGHPALTQGDSKINADTLIFEIANSKFIAQGHAHSEVISNGQTEIDPKAPPGGKKETKKVIATKPTSKSTNSKQPFAWPKAGDEESAVSPAPAPATTQTVASAKKGNTKDNSPVEKIITDSDYQEYEKDSGKFDATGHVHVIHGNISVNSDKLRLVYGTDGKPETALFTGHVNALQDSNNTQAEAMTYYLSTKRLQATGNVRSKMIQQKPADSKLMPGKKTIGMQTNAGAATALPTTRTGIDDDNIVIVSDAQDFNQDTGKMAAEGHVRVYYQDTVGIGPKAVLLRNPEGKAERVIFLGRSQISQAGKRWIADRITMAVSTKKILAEGNTKALIIGSPSKPNTQPQTNSALASSKVEAVR